jgi:nitrogenase molybdenum-iron protein alpha/beta subunit
MGYWRMQGSHSILFREVPEEEVTGVWGDAPADIIGDAVDRIIETFQDEFGRMPTKTELQNGLLFTIQVMDELPE